MRHLLPAILVLTVACSEEQPPPPLPKPKPVAASQPASAPVAAASAPVLKEVTTGPRVVAIEGEGTVDGEPAKVGTPVTPTSVITTGEKSQMSITLHKGSLIQVRQGAKVELGKSERREFSIKVLAGALWSFLPKGSNYEVVAGNAVAGARGTVYYVESHGPTDTYVCACDGEIEMTVGGKKKNLKSKMQHIGMNIKGADAKAKPSPTKKVLNHTKDEAKALLEVMAKLE